MNTPRVWILTHTGRRVQLDEPDPDVVCLDDIAHALARITRFTGHGHAPLSVAQHCCMVSARCPNEAGAWGLLHDAHEAYIGDISSPMGRLIDWWAPGKLAALKADWDTAIGLRFGVMPIDVKAHDLLAMMTEVNKNGPEGMPMSEWESLNGVQPPLKGYEQVSVMSAIEAEYHYLAIARSWGIK